MLAIYGNIPLEKRMFSCQDVRIDPGSGISGLFSPRIQVSHEQKPYILSVNGSTTGITAVISQYLNGIEV